MCVTSLSVSCYCIAVYPLLPGALTAHSTGTLLTRFLVLFLKSRRDLHLTIFTCPVLIWTSDFPKALPSCSPNEHPGSGIIDVGQTAGRVRRVHKRGYCSRWAFEWNRAFDQVPS